MQNVAVDSGLRLSAQRALLGAISPNIRLIKITRHDRAIALTVIAATPLLEGEREVSAIAATEIVADFPGHTINEEVIIDVKPIAWENVLAAGWVYRRAESSVVTPASSE